jgi:hypothetical protein
MSSSLADDFVAAAFADRANVGKYVGFGPGPGRPRVVTPA